MSARICTKPTVFSSKWIGVGLTAGCFLVLVGFAIYAPTYAASSSMQAYVQRTTSINEDQQPVLTPTVLPSVTQEVKSEREITRINQLDRAQYGSDDELNTWGYKACGAASVATVLNYWWGEAKYRISDVLVQASAAKAISSELGWLDEEGFARTFRRFGFETEWGRNKWSVDELVAMANDRKPAVISFPPGADARFPYGHILLVRGGDANVIHLVDSYQTNLQTLSRAEFEQSWRGFAAVASPAPYSILGQPTITAEQINNVLDAYQSPMAGQGQMIYDLLTKSYGIDPAIALSFFLHESTMGTKGVATKTKSWGNLRCIPGAECVDQDRGGYASFPTWEQGLEAWAKLIVSELYVGDGRILVDDIIPRYAPAADSNNEQNYIHVLKQSVDAWRAGRVAI